MAPLTAEERKMTTELDRMQSHAADIKRMAEELYKSVARAEEAGYHVQVTPLDATTIGGPREYRVMVRVSGTAPEVTT